MEKGGTECTCEARVRAFLRLLKWTEGTENEGDDAYRTLFSFKKFDDYSKYPMDIVKASGYSSSAAGAYQINIACYKTLQGYYKNKLNQWKQDTNNDYITKYKINGFTPLEQDKLTLLILIHKRKGLIHDIINKEFSKGLRIHASYEWASMPPKRYDQPAKSFEEVANRYKKYFEEELEGNTNLYLEEGFLKEFGIKCNCKSSSSADECTCGKKHIDLTDKMIFYDQGSGNQKCNLTCKAIMRQMGVEAEGATEVNRHSFYQLALEDSIHSKLVFAPEKIKTGMAYLDSSLDKNEPVLVGLDHTLDGGINNEGDIQTTDHYVIIIGRKCINGKVYYPYWDVGTMHGSKDAYRFELQSDGTLINENGYGGRNKPDGRKYTVTQIRRNSKVKL
ncbi:hypothetical protein [Cellulophaga sp. L1A9]|uniref:hypothetical protein n=1 Tax=Cellulophaga sp. L1A9 TaxID=2686362 RepID=UPI00131DE4C4|nr:hypothetical protein [Cellulophaga sp. L1A9]